MSKRFLISMIVLALSAAAVGVGTYALYTDSETSADNTFTAGSLDLQVWDGTAFVDDPNVPAINAAFDDQVNNLKPGDSGSITIPVKNAGTVGGTARLDLTGLVEAAGDDSPDIEDTLLNGTADLAAAVDVDIKFDGVSVKTGTLQSIAAEPVFDGGTLGAGVEKAWTIDLSIDSSVGNEVMDDTASCDVVFGLNQ